MTPYEFSVLLHYYVSGAEHPDYARQVPVWDPTIRGLLACGMIEMRDGTTRPNSASYKTTEKADVWIKTVLSTPFPVQRWVVER